MNTVSLDINNNADDESVISDGRQEDFGVADNGYVPKDSVVE